MDFLHKLIVPVLLLPKSSQPVHFIVLLTLFLLLLLCQKFLEMFSVYRIFKFSSCYRRRSQISSFEFMFRFLFFVPHFMVFDFLQLYTLGFLFNRFKRCFSGFNFRKYYRLCESLFKLMVKGFLFLDLVQSLGGFNIRQQLILLPFLDKLDRI